MPRFHSMFAYPNASLIATFLPSFRPSFRPSPSPLLATVASRRDLVDDRRERLVVEEALRLERSGLHLLEDLLHLLRRCRSTESVEAGRDRIQTGPFAEDQHRLWLADELRAVGEGLG